MILIHQLRGEICLLYYRRYNQPNAAARSLTPVQLLIRECHGTRCITYGPMRVSCRISWGGVFNPEQILMPLNITANGSQFPSWWPDYIQRYQTGICGLFVRSVCVRTREREKELRHSRFCDRFTSRVWLSVKFLD